MVSDAILLLVNVDFCVEEVAGSNCIRAPTNVLLFVQSCEKDVSGGNSISAPE